MLAWLERRRGKLRVVDDLGELTREQLLDVVAAQQARIDELLVVVASQAQQITVLTARVTELERQLGRNSKNSSMPPSADAFIGEKRRPRGASGRRVGKQPGSDGKHLAMVDDPDVVVDHQPGACGGCGQNFDVAGRAGAGFVRRQVHDLPERIASVITEHRLHRRRCGCGTVTTAPAPAGVQAPTQYGPVLTAWITYLLVVQHVPYARAVELIADLCPGLTPSTGWAVAALQRIGQALTPTLEAIRDRLRDPTVSPVLHVDETSTSIAGKTWWLHVACTPSFTSFHLDPSRGRSAVTAHDVLPGYTGVAVHDALSVYDAYPQASHALCGAHLLRELTAAGEAHPDQAWPQAAIDALTGLLALAHAARAAGQVGAGGLEAHNAGTAQRLRQDYRHAVLCGLARHPLARGRKQSTTRNLLQRMQARSAQILAFTRDLRIPFTNNQAERDLRPAKTQLKISGCHRSEPTARAWLVVRSAISTGRKQGRNPLTDLRNALTGNPWIPAQT